jgi:D-arabinose 1-dehydrogenase-like Zn-dependent alcohol dehydrogenase
LNTLLTSIPDWNVILPLLAPDSIILPLTVSQGDLTIPYMPFLVQGLRFQGSVVAPRAIHRKMLDFAARHDVKPIIMEFPMTEEGIEQGMKTLDDGKMRYRGVLVPQ